MPTLFPSQRSFGLFSAAFSMTVGVLLVNVVDPYSGAVASPYYMPAAPVVKEPTQLLQVVMGFR
jgi:hypothetical protein